MIDTTKLMLDKSMFTILDSSRFERDITNASRGYSVYVQNSTASELKKGIYKPRLSLTHRFNCSGRSEKTLSIELSLPKLIYHDNFNELVDDDFGIVYEKLKATLRDMAVYVYDDSLINAPVSAIHYSKNIPLTDGSTPHYLISKIKEANISTVLDESETSYMNGGYGYKWHTSSYEVAFYDKIDDLGKSKKQGDKRAIEKDNAIQLSLLDTFQTRRQFEVLRMEVRLNQRQKMRKMFKNLGIDTELTFQSLYSSTISQKILLHYLDEVESKRPRLLDLETGNPKALLAELVINNPKLGALKTLQAFGLKQALNTTNPRELRAMFGKYSERSWYRLIAEAKKIKTPPTKSPFEVIRRHLTSFKPFKLVDFQDRMINNDKYD